KSAAGNADAATLDRGEINQFAGRIAALERTAKTLEAQLQNSDSAAAAARAARSAFLMLALRTAVERGEPYKAELAAAKPLLRAADFAALEPLAETATPTGPALADELSKLVPAV